VHVLGARADGLRRWHAKNQRWIERFGPPLLLLAWVPLLGDALVLAAGAARVNVLACLLWQALGRTLRYLIIVELYRAL
jgi:membrane protein YqaA with SNARE-associated domain